MARVAIRNEPAVIAPRCLSRVLSGERDKQVNCKRVDSRCHKVLRGSGHEDNIEDNSLVVELIVIVGNRPQRLGAG
jgi:hypothetical protein